MKQITAVEWLFENLIELNADMKYSTITWEKYLSKRVGLLDQAKAMEKEQIESAYRKGYTESSWGRHSNSEQYYNEHYGK